MTFNIYDKVSKGKELTIEEIKKTLKILKKIESKGGIVVIFENNTLITTYRLKSYNPKLARLH